MWNDKNEIKREKEKKKLCQFKRKCSSTVFWFSFACKKRKMFDQHCFRSHRRHKVKRHFIPFFIGVWCVPNLECFWLWRFSHKLPVRESQTDAHKQSQKNEIETVSFHSLFFFSFHFQKCLASRCQNVRHHRNRKLIKRLYLNSFFALIFAQDLIDFIAFAFWFSFRQFFSLELSNVSKKKHSNEKNKFRRWKSAK